LDQVPIGILSLAIAPLPLTIDVLGLPRTLCTLQYRPTSGDVTLIVKRGGYNQRPGEPPSAKIIEQHFSIHQSPDLPEHTLKFTAKYDHYTNAINLKNSYAPLFLERCRNLSEEKYVNKNSGVSIGRFDPTMWQLFYTLGVSHVEKSADYYTKASLSYKNFVFGNLRFHIWWSFALIPSDSSGNMMIYYTRHQDELALLAPIEANFFRKLKNGIQSIEWVELTSVFMRQQLLQYIDGMPFSDAETPAVMVRKKALKAMASFFNDTKSPTLRAHLNSLHFLPLDIKRALGAKYLNDGQG
jgi:hypothetical protein